jgi:hypothetical protein
MDLTATPPKNSPSTGRLDGETSPGQPAGVRPEISQILQNSEPP